MLDSVEDLRRSLQAKGSDLVIRWGKPEDIVPELVRSLPNVTAVYMQSEVPRPSPLPCNIPLFVLTSGPPTGVQRGGGRGKAIADQVLSAR
jgi:hypothetical protein